MAFRLAFPTKCLVVILLSLFAVSVPVGSRVGATPAVAIIVSDHGLAEQVNYTRRGHVFVVNKTSTFTQDDRFVIAYFTATMSSANVTWLWYDPDGQLYLNQTQQLQCDVSPCTFVKYFPLKYSDAANKFGLWSLTLQAGGIDLYSDYFSVMQIVTQDNYWNFEITQSMPPRAHGDLMVTIHPTNKTWSSYSVSLPFATNITAREFPSNGTLSVVTFKKTSGVVVNLGGARSDGYRFVLSFDLVYGVGWLGGGVFVFNWYESAWGTFGDGYHSVPGSFNLTLPAGATFLDIAGINAMNINPSVMEGPGPVVGFRTTLLPGQGFGWRMLYRDPHGNVSPNSEASTNPLPGEQLNVVLAKSIPFLPLTLGSLSQWTAVMSIFLLTGSELLTPAYGRTGVLINRRRLRVAALILASIFIATTVYEIVLLQSVLPQVGR
jgi:hypothetical protein